MGAKYLRRDKARACPVHVPILRLCSKKLGENGFFEKDDVIGELRYEAVEDSIRWDYIAGFLREELGIELVPLASRFFKQHDRAERVVAPERFIASGHGKKTAGYAHVALDDGRLALRVLKWKTAQANGSLRSQRNLLKAIDKEGLLPQGLSTPLLAAGPTDDTTGDD